MKLSFPHWLPPARRGVLTKVLASIAILLSSLLTTGSPLHADPATSFTISPNSGSIYGQTAVNITIEGGTPFTARDPFIEQNFVVFFGGEAVQSGINAMDADTITMETPASVVGLGAVDVEIVFDIARDGVRDSDSNPGDEDDVTITLEDGFNYGAPSPTVASVWPNAGSRDGDTEVAISVSDMAAVTPENIGDFEVSFGEVTADPGSFEVVDSNTISVASPEQDDREIGLVDIEVRLGTEVAVLADGFRYERVSPSSGSVQGGTVITLAKTSSDHATAFVVSHIYTVRFDGLLGTNVQRIDNDTLMVTTPASMDFAAGVVNVEIFESGISIIDWNDSFMYRPELEVSTVGIDRVHPDTGMIDGGETVSITTYGMNFQNGPIGPEDITVLFGDQPAMVSSIVGEYVIEVVVPESDGRAVGQVDISVALNDQVAFWADAYTYQYIDTSFGSMVPDGDDRYISLPASAAALVEAEFGAGVTVQFGALLSPLVSWVDADTLRAEIPENVSRTAGLVDVIVTYPGESTGLVFEDLFEYLAVSPPSGDSEGPDNPLLTVTVDGLEVDVSDPAGIEVMFFLDAACLVFDPGTGDYDPVQAQLSGTVLGVFAPDTLLVEAPFFNRSDCDEEEDTRLVGLADIVITYGSDLFVLEEAFTYSRGRVSSRYDFGDYGEVPDRSSCFAADGRPVGVQQLMLGELASRTRRGELSGGGVGPVFTVSGIDGRTDGAYSFETDVPYGRAISDPIFQDPFSTYLMDGDSHYGWSREGNEVGESGADTIFDDCYSISYGSAGGRSDILELESDLWCSGAGYSNQYSVDPDLYSYCSIFGPEVYSEPFYANAGQSLSFDWGAQSVSDDYEIYAFLVRVNDPEDGIPTKAQALAAVDSEDPGFHSLVLYSRGNGEEGDDDVQFVTSAAEIPEDGYWRFRFVNGSFDGTGGHALGARMNLDPTIFVGRTNEITFDEIADATGVGVEVDLDISATSNEPVSLVSLTDSVCSVARVSGTWVVTTLLGDATCSLRASQAAIAPFSAAASVTRSFQVLASSSPPPAPSSASGNVDPTLSCLASGNPERSLRPGIVRVSEMGRDVAASIQSDVQSRSLQIRGPAFELQLSAGPNSSGSPATRLSSSGDLLMQQGQFVIAEGSGYKPLSDVKIFLLANPVQIGIIRADAKGAFKGSVSIPRDLAAGEHALQLNGFMPGGCVRSTSVGVVVAKRQRLSLRVSFTNDSFELSEDSVKAINRFTNQIKALSPRLTTVSVSGFVRKSPWLDEAGMKTLSTRRARVVADALRSRGVSGAYSISGRGPTKDGGASSRRAMVVVDVLS